jgi:hypothetical protein
MTVENVLQRLDKVKKTGAFKWQARCPSHDDKGPSLAIRELDDGRVLLHCFAGCGASEVLGTIGLEFSDLYPDCDGAHMPRVRKPWNAMDVLTALAFEVLVALQYANQLARGIALSEMDQQRLLSCASRLQAGLGAVNG